MTREQFKKIEQEHGFMEAMNMFAEECDDIHTSRSAKVQSMYTLRRSRALRMVADTDTQVTDIISSTMQRLKRAPR